MGLNKQERFLKTNNNIKVISIKTTTSNFDRRFLSVSEFWKNFRNGLFSIGNITNREMMRGITGVYFSLQMKEQFQILIVYDSSSKSFNQVDLKARIKKLLGISAVIEFGEFQEFEPIINEIFVIKTKIQPFGELYFQQS
jgi:hypothetical protein